MNRSESKYFNTATKMDLALIALLKKKPLEYITVSELCKTAGVNRSTFYLHYETIHDLLRETAQYLIDDFRSCFPTDAVDMISCDQNELIFICDQYLTPYLTYIKDHQEVFCTAVSHQELLGFEDTYKLLFDHIFNPILDRFHYPESDRPYVMLYYLTGINAIVLEWLRNHCDKSTREISEIISVCIFGLKR